MGRTSCEVRELKFEKARGAVNGIRRTSCEVRELKYHFHTTNKMNFKSYLL